MIFLLNALEKFFEDNKCLYDFKDEYIKLMQTNIINFKKQHVNGTYKKDILYRTDNYEIVLISWGSNSTTPIHCHPENGCLLHVLQGELFEYRYNHKNKLFKVTYLTKGDTGYMHRDIGKHKVVNNTNKTCYSLHIYSPPHFYDKN